MTTTSSRRGSRINGGREAQRRAIQKALAILGAPELLRPISSWKDFVMTLDRRREAGII
mgnify:CR=1 FL=1